MNGVETNVYDLEDLLLDGVSGFLDHRILIDRRDGRDVLTLVLTPEDEGARSPAASPRVSLRAVRLSTSCWRFSSRTPRR